MLTSLLYASTSYRRVLGSSIRPYTTTPIIYKAHSPRRRTSSRAQHFIKASAAGDAAASSSSSPSTRRSTSNTRSSTPTPLNVTQEDLRAQSSESENLAREHHGIFQSQHIKPFPVRAAIDIGTGGAISLCIGRVDAHAGAIQKLMYQTQLPLYLEKLHHSSSGNYNTNADAQSSNVDYSATEGSFTLSERTLSDITNKMRVLHGAMKRNAFEGLSERAAVLSWPLCAATNAQSLAAALTREFKVDVRVLGINFEAEWPVSVVQAHEMHTAAASAAAAAPPFSFSVSDRAQNFKNTMREEASEGKDFSAASQLPSEPPVVKGKDRLKALLRNAATAHASGLDRSANTSSSQQSHASVRHSSTKEDETVSTPGSRGRDLRQQVDTLAFLAHAAVSQCVAPQRLLVLSEDPQRGIRVLGVGTTPAAEVADLLAAADGPDAVAKLKAIAFGDSENNLNQEVRARSPRASMQDTQTAQLPPPFESRKVTENLPHESKLKNHRMQVSDTRAVVPVLPSSEGLQLVEHTLPVDVATAHRYCITHVQRRSPNAYGLHTSSPNPLLPDEFAALRGLLTDTITPTLPRWVTRKAQLGGMVVATSHNGGLFNIAARVAQQTHVSLDHLEVHAQHHFCGLTDVLLAETFPNPLLVLPSAALGCAVLRSLASPRLLYVPEVNMAAGLLIQPSLWLASRAAAVRRRLSRDPFFHAHTRAQRGRFFEKPHRKENPTAAPEATSEHGRSWNPLSYEQSMKGM